VVPNIFSAHEQDVYPQASNPCEDFSDQSFITFVLGQGNGADQVIALNREDLYQRLTQSHTPLYRFLFAPRFALCLDKEPPPPLRQSAFNVWTAFVAMTRLETQNAFGA
jgi:hypothetical protein